MQEPSTKKICAVSNMTTLVDASPGPAKKGILVQVCSINLLTCFSVYILLKLYGILSFCL